MLKFLGYQLLFLGSKRRTWALLAFALAHVTSVSRLSNRLGDGDGERFSLRGVTKPGELQPPPSWGEGVRLRLMNCGEPSMVLRFSGGGCTRVIEGPAAPEVEPLR